MKRIGKITLFFVIVSVLTAMAEERRSYIGYTFTESEWKDFGDTRCGTSLVKLDSVTSCYAVYYKGSMTPTPLYERYIKEIENVTRIDSSETYHSYLGRSTDGTCFVEKQFFDRPKQEGIIFYQIPKEYLEEVVKRLDKQWYLPIELFQDSLLRLMDYKLIGACIAKYEEGYNGMGLAMLDSAKYCVVHYFNGAMMATPLYLRREIERVEHSNMSTGELYYGKLTDGTFFVEKEFYENLWGLPQGLIMFRIPKECYEDVLQRMASLPSLSIELFEVKPLMEK